MLGKKLDGQMGKIAEDGKNILDEAQKKGELIAQHYEDRNFAKALIEIRNIADEANRYFDQREPWKLIKEKPEETRSILTLILNIFSVMAIYLKPVLPTYVAKVETLFLEKSYVWSDSQVVLENQGIAKFEHLATRIDQKSIDSLVG